MNLEQIRARIKDLGNARKKIDNEISELKNKLICECGCKWLQHQFINASGDCICYGQYYECECKSYRETLKD